jgi:hypothetical protein
VDELDLGPGDNGYLNDSEKHDKHQWQHEGELDHGGPSLTGHARFATDMTFCMTVLKKDGSISVVEAHEMSANATTAAATSTRAYSAVA